MDWDDSATAPTYKKGDGSSSENYRGFSLMRIALTLFVGNSPYRLANAREKRTRKKQAGFRPAGVILSKYSTSECEHIFRNLRLFLNLKETFDSVECVVLWRLPLTEGCARGIRSTYPTSYIRTTETEFLLMVVSPEFIKRIVCQGCLLSVFFFSTLPLKR